MSDQKGGVQFKLPRSNTYRRRAEECRKLARIAPNSVRERYIKLADAYERRAALEEKRGRQLRRPLSFSMSSRGNCRVRRGVVHARTWRISPKLEITSNATLTPDRTGPILSLSTMRLPLWLQPLLGLAEVIEERAAFAAAHEPDVCRFSAPHGDRRPKSVNARHRRKWVVAAPRAMRIPQ
jgi:hypothetical protein